MVKYFSIAIFFYPSNYPSRAGFTNRHNKLLIWGTRVHGLTQTNLWCNSGGPPGWPTRQDKTADDDDDIESNGGDGG